jgi:hypothetical protein
MNVDHFCRTVKLLSAYSGSLDKFEVWSLKLKTFVDVMG